MNFKELKTNILHSDQQTRIDYDNLELEYQLINQFIKIRIAQNITQKELAELIGTKQTNISRIENGKSLPSLVILNKIAQALNKKLKITIE